MEINCRAIIMEFRIIRLKLFLYQQHGSSNSIQLKIQAICHSHTHLLENIFIAGRRSLSSNYNL
jgi:hypothetical protein